jgi:cell division protein FtsL
MLRLNFLLLLVVVLCALSTVSANDAARRLLGESERAQNRARALNVEWGQLQLEQSTWANHARIEQVARARLAMRPPNSARVIALETPQ